MGEIPVAIFLDPDGIDVVAHAGDEIGRSGKLVMGDTWRIGAVDKDAFPYEVLIVVVQRRV
jgi:hypothetical protein